MLKNQSSSAKQEIPAVSQEGDLHDFIPYFSHYNPHTILTKNGELLQVVKIDGNFIGSGCENLDGVHASIRSSVRHVVTKSGIDDKLSFWVHTIRKRSNMGYKHPDVDISNVSSFNDYVDAAWNKENSWDSYYQNEIYLTILYEGEPIPLADIKNIKTLSFPKSNRRARGQYLENASLELDSFVNSVVDILRTQCSAFRLGLVERQISNAGKVARPQIFYSEPMEFLSTLLNLKYEPFALPDMDLSVAMQSAKLAFGINALEAKNKISEESRFAAVLTLKQYVESYVEAVDCIMQSQMEIYVSQSFNFIPADKALKNYKDQKNLFSMSGDVKLNKNFGITQVLNFNKNNPTDYCLNQVSFTIISDSIENLDTEVEKFLNSFARLGLIAIREDMMMQEAFLASLPGNFEFIRRPSPLASEYIGGFCRLNRFHFGSPTGNHWGNYLAAFPTSVNSPYFFNFHVQDNGHTVIFDFNSFEDSVGKILQYLLLTKTLGFGAKIVIFDYKQSARLLINKLGGKMGKNYFTMDHFEKKNVLKKDKPQTTALNPFLLEPSNYNKSFLAAWCGLLISSDTPLEAESKKIISESIEKLFEMEFSQRNLKSLINLVVRHDSALAKSLEDWVERGDFAKLFDFESDELDMSLDMLAFDMTTALSNRRAVLPLFSYLMHKVIQSVDGKPAVIVINEAFDLLENAFFAPRLESLLEMLKQRNVMVIFNTSKPIATTGTVSLPAVMAGTATKIYVPDDMPVNYKSEDMMLNDQDDIMLSDMFRQKGDFLLKQNGESIVLRASMSEAEDVIAILTNDIKSLGSARGKFTGVPKDY